jgi:hypothetical protein
MAEHYPAGTLEVTAYCAVCKRETQHRVDFPPGGGNGGGRRGPCLNPHPPSKAQLAKEAKRRRESQNPRLF